jgi:metallo-beta-lactamase family protein
MIANKTITLQSLGAAGTVTGSKHVLRTPELTIMVDCGLFQGIKSLRQQNWNDLPVNPADIDVVLLTHAHLDHCGYIPLLVKKGFRGNIFCTDPTRDLTKIILFDSAKIQEEDAEKANEGHYSKHDPALPLYTNEDVTEAMNYIKGVGPDIAIKLSDNIDFTFRGNGHILGAAFIEMNCYSKRITFSGDIGRYNSDFMPTPEEINPADFIVMESTYGNRIHELSDPAEELINVIYNTLDKHGTLIIPSFAVGRAQEIIHILHKLRGQRQLPEALITYLDSPMATEATLLLSRYPKWHKLEMNEVENFGEEVVFTANWRHTDKIIRKKESKIVISASGMITGGRILEYIKRLGSDRHNTILFIGYQAEGTRGRALQEGANELKIHGSFYSINAAVESITSLSAHADQEELLRWMEPSVAAEPKIFLVHGEPDALEALRVKIEFKFNLQATVSEQNNVYELFTIE